MSLNLSSKKHGSEFDHIAPSEQLMAIMLEMGFDAADSATALSCTKNVGVQPAIDYITAHPDCGKLAPPAPAAVSPATSPSSKAAVSFGAPPPLTSIIDTSARDALARKQQEERAEKAKVVHAK